MDILIPSDMDIQEASLSDVWPPRSPTIAPRPLLSPQGSSNEVREMAAEGLGELVQVTGDEALRPFVVTITGPLIRIIGDRFPSQVWTGRMEGRSVWG